MIETEKNLASIHPRLAKEWHPTKNGELTPEFVTSGSNKKVWWLGECGHEWEAFINERVRGYGCPICAGKRIVIGVNDFESAYPQLSKQWDYNKNGNLLPSMVAPKSHKKVWWICEKGHSWQTSIDNRSRGRGCPFCTSKIIANGENDLASQNPFLAAEYSKKNIKQSCEVFLNSHNKVWWTCPVCGNEWQATVYSRQQGNGCPNCAKKTQSSFPEQAIFYYIKQKYPDAINRCKSVLDGNLEIDVYIPSIKIGIEYDGQHWHKGNRSDARERKKYSLCKQKGILLIRIRESSSLEEAHCDHIININDGLNAAIAQLSEFFSLPSEIDIDKDRIKILENYIRNIRENSLNLIRPDLSKEWDYNKNGALTPDMFTEYSTIKVWWKCSNGHEWESTIAHRTSMGVNCPYCSNRKVLVGYNDLATTNPELLAKWDFEKNTISPKDVTAGSKRKIWWRCSEGHSWKTSVGEMKNGHLCPICSGHQVLIGFNDLCTTHPTLVDEWNYKKNIGLSPEMFSFGSNKKVWWKCRFGHEWQSMILSRSKGRGCPYCSKRYAIPGENDISITHPELVEEWDYKKNPLPPTAFTYGSGKRVWWVCKDCGKEWQAAVKDRTNGHGCPVCARRKNKQRLYNRI